MRKHIASRNGWRGFSKVIFRTDEHFKNPKDLSGSCFKGGKSIEWNQCLDFDFGEFNSEIRPLVQKLADAENKNNNREISTDYSNGQPHIRAKKVNGRYEGKYQAFFESGKLALERTYLKGVATDEKRYFPEGGLERETRFENRQAVQGTEYFQSGRKRIEFMTDTTQKPPRKNVVEYYENGSKESDYQVQIDVDYFWGYDGEWGFAYEKYVGDLKTYSHLGELVTHEHFNDKGRVDGPSTYHYSDNEYVEETWKDGILQERQVFDGKKQLLRKKTEYFPDGSVKRNLDFKAASTI